MNWNIVRTICTIASGVCVIIGGIAGDKINDRKTDIKLKELLENKKGQKSS